MSNQPHFLAIYRSTLIILYTLSASSYSDCLIACLTLILTTIFGLLFNLVSLDWWVPVLNNALHWKLYSAILIIPGDGSWSSVQMIVLSLLTPHPNTEPIRLDLFTLPRLAWSGLSTSVISDSVHVCRAECRVITSDTVSPLQHSELTHSSGMGTEQPSAASQRELIFQHQTIIMEARIINYSVTKLSTELAHCQS